VWPIFRNFDLLVCVCALMYTTSNCCKISKSLRDVKTAPFLTNSTTLAPTPRNHVNSKKVFRVLISREGTGSSVAPSGTKCDAIYRERTENTTSKIPPGQYSLFTSTTTYYHYCYYSPKYTTSSINIDVTSFNCFVISFFFLCS